jgi:hypothetical protein
MAFDDSRIKKGNISNYENASDEFLKQRLEQIRVEIREPHLSVSEFLQGVVTQAGFTALAAGWTAWQGLGKGLDWLATSKSSWASKLTNKYMNMTGEGGTSIGFMKDEKSYTETLTSVSKSIAEMLMGEAGTTPDSLLQTLIDKPKALGHTGAVERLTELQKEFKTLSEEAKKTRLLEVLQEVNKRDGQAHVGQYAKLWERIEQLRASSGLTSHRLGEEAFLDLKSDIIGRGLEDNNRIINKYRIPTTGILVAGAALFAGYRSHHSSLKQKMLDLESEATYIERLQRERQQTAEAKNINTEAPEPESKNSEKIESPKKSDSHLERLEASRELRDLETSPALG